MAKRLKTLHTPQRNGYYWIKFAQETQPGKYKITPWYLIWYERQRYKSRDGRDQSLPGYFLCGSDEFRLWDSTIKLIVAVNGPIPTPTELARAHENEKSSHPS